MVLGRTQWTCRLLRPSASVAEEGKAWRLGECTMSTTGKRLHVKLPEGWRELPPTGLLPYFESGHSAEVAPLLKR